MPTTPKRLTLYLLKVFDITEDELQKTLLLQLNIFLILTTLLIVKPTINSLFLSELSASALPAGYVLTAIFAIIGSFFYDKALAHFSLNKIIIRTLIGSIITLVLFCLALNFKLKLGLFLYIPYIWVAIYGLLTTSQFWILANIVYNAREAKRVFGFIGAGAIAGGIFGGYLTSALSSFVSSENLLLVAAFLLFWCIPITKFIWSKEVVRLSHYQLAHLKSEHIEKSPFKMIKSSPLLSSIGIVIGIGVIVAKLVDYQYSHFASEIITDKQELTAFFAFWLSTLSVISLLVQLFLTNRIVGRLGVGKSLLWLPTGILIGSVLLLFFPELWVVIFIKIADGSLKQSVNKAATELLMIPVPLEVKKKTKTFIDVVIDSIATGIAGFLLMFVIHVFKGSYFFVSILTIIFILVWIFFIFRLKKEYINAFKSLLERPHSKSKKLEQPKKEVPVNTIVGSIKNVFKNGNESQILHMLHRTLETPDERFFEDLKNLLNHESEAVRALAIENLYFLKTDDLSSLIEPLIFEEDQEITTHALRYIIKNKPSEASNIFNKYSKIKDDESIENAVLIALSQELHNSPTLQKKFNFTSTLEEAVNEWIHFEEGPIKTNKLKTILEVIGNIKTKEFYSIITQSLASNQNDIVIQALISVKEIKSKDFIDPMLSRLWEKTLRDELFDALHAYGEGIIDYLTKCILDDKITLKNSQFIPKVIEQFESQKAINALIKLIDTTEHSVSIEAIESLKRLKWKHKNLKVRDGFVIGKILDECQVYQNILSSLHSQIIISYKEAKINTSQEIAARKGLMQILEQRLDRQLHRIFSFLGIKYLPEDIDPLLDIIRSGEEEQRAYAIEFLDNLLNIDLKKELIPIAESAFIDNEISEDIIKKLNLQVYSEYKCYQILLERHDIKIKHAVLYLIEKSGEKRFIPLVKIVLNDPSKLIREQALQTLNILDNQPNL